MRQMKSRVGFLRAISLPFCDKRTSSQLLKTITVTGDWKVAKFVMYTMGPLPMFISIFFNGRWLWNR